MYLYLYKAYNKYTNKYINKYSIYLSVAIISSSRIQWNIVRKGRSQEYQNHRNELKIREAKE